jgi:hypothetical protein
MFEGQRAKNRWLICFTASSWPRTSLSRHMALNVGLRGEPYTMIRSLGYRDIAPFNGHLGWLGSFGGVSCPASSTQTQAALGWHPTGPGALGRLEQRRLFRNLNGADQRIGCRIGGGRGHHRA